MSPTAPGARGRAVPDEPARAFCWRCAKPEVACVCASVPRVEPRTRVVVLQHPRERFHPIGTVRFVELGVADSRVEAATLGALTERPQWIESRAALLYPAPGARRVEELAPGDRPSQLVVLDGTWHHARTLYRDLAWLRDLTAVRLTPTAPSRYRLRREPTVDSVSTIEAVVGALRVLEPELRGLDALLEAFDRMIDWQAEHVRRGGGGRRMDRARPRAWRAFPRGLVEDWGALVVVYAEGALVSAPGEPERRALAQIVAHRPATGETYERLVRLPSAALLSPLVSHAGLSAEELAAAQEPAVVQAELAGWLPRGAVVAAWNATTLDLVLPAGRTAAGALVLKAAFGSATGRAGGVLEVRAAALGLDVPALPVCGRARQRLGAAVAVAEWLRRCALGGIPSSPPS